MVEQATPQKVIEQPAAAGPAATEAEAAYTLAYLLIFHLDNRLRQNYHLRDCGGQAITRLDEWLAAVAAGRWPGPGGNGVGEVCWSETW